MAGDKKAKKKKEAGKKSGSGVSAVNLQKTLQDREKERKKMLEDMFK